MFCNKCITCSKKRKTLVQDPYCCKTQPGQSPSVLTTTKKAPKFRLMGMTADANSKAFMAELRQATFKASMEMAPSAAGVTPDVWRQAPDETMHSLLQAVTGLLTVD